jgi:hypothetical protein
MSSYFNFILKFFDVNLSHKEERSIPLLSGTKECLRWPSQDIPSRQWLQVTSMLQVNTGLTKSQMARHTAVHGSHVKIATLSHWEHKS